jgi:HK97 family phage prohead protease
MTVRKRYASAKISGDVITGFIPFNSESGPLQDYGGKREVIDPGAFVISDKLFVNRNHNNDIVIGRLGVNVAVEQKPDGIAFTVKDPGTETFARSYEDIKSGITPSISFEFGDEETEEKDGIVHVTKAELRAISLNVPNPAYEEAESQARSLARALELAREKKFCNNSGDSRLIIDGMVNLTAARSITPHDSPERNTILNFARGFIPAKEKSMEMDEKAVEAIVAKVLKGAEEKKADEERAKKRAVDAEGIETIRKTMVQILGDDFAEADIETLSAAFMEQAKALAETRADKEEADIEAKEEEKERCANVSAYRRDRLRALGLSIFNKKRCNDVRLSFREDATIKMLREAANAVKASGQSEISDYEEVKA